MLAIAMGVSGAMATAADAATITLDRPCYVSEGRAHQQINVLLAGFSGAAPVRVSVFGRTYTVTTDQAGNFFGALDRVPSIAPSNQRRFTVTATDGYNTATAGLYVTRVRAAFYPSRGDVRTLRVRFLVYGMGAFLAATFRPIREVAYLHWLRPDGRPRSTRRLGKLHGPCGSLVTERQRLLPFRPERGRWRLLFDTRASFSDHVAEQIGVGLFVGSRKQGAR
jgi:hypothetical protein